MDSMAYLNQISSKPIKKASIFSDKKTKIIAIICGAALIVAIAIIIISSIASKKPDYNTKLKKRAENVSSIITDKTYKDHIKSTSLRAATSQLNNLLSAVTGTLTKYYDKTTEKLSEDTKTKEKKNLSSLKQTLDNAKINGTLDRVYAREIAYQIKTLISYEKECRSHTNNKAYKDFLTSSISSLETLLPSFSDF